MTAIYRYLAWGFVGVCLLAFVGTKAYIAGSDNAHNADTAAAAKQQQAVLTRYIALDRTSQSLGHELSTTRQADTLAYNTLLNEVAHDQNPIIPVPVAIPGALPMLTVRAVCLFDAAWRDPDTGGPAAAGQPGQSACAGPDAEGPSQFNIHDALYSDAENARVCWADISQLRILIRYEKARISGSSAPPKP